jgi:glycosyltransferase involved in cell wall biosynthesis
MRILVISHEYPPVGGGGGKVAQDLSRGFVKAGHQVRLITAHYGDLKREEDDQGVLLTRVKSLRKKAFQAGLPAMLAFVLCGAWTALKTTRAWKPDLIHVHFAVPAGPIGWLTQKLTRVPYVLTVHLGDVPGGTPQKTGRWFKFIFPFTPPIWKSAARVVAVSAFTRELALKSYDVPIDVIHNGITIEPKTGQLTLASPPEIVFAGRLIDQKDPLQLVKILAHCKQNNWHCTLFGDGPLKEAVKTEIAAQGLRSRFSLPGWVTPQEVQAHFAGSDILLMPSLSEGLPVVGVQALQAGLCLVVSRIGGFLDLVDEDQNGYLLPAGGGGLWSEVLDDLLANPSKLAAMKEKSLIKVREFDLQTVVQSYLRLFAQAKEQGN